MSDKKIKEFIKAVKDLDYTKEYAQADEKLGELIKDKIRNRYEREYEKVANRIES